MLPKLEQMDEKQLDKSLSQFYIEARSKRGGGIQQFLANFVPKCNREAFTTKL